jgi:hypothetical protein
MKIYKLFIIASFAILSVACSWFGGESNVNANLSNSANVPQPANETVKTENKPVEPEIVYPKETYSQVSPTEAFKTYIKATVNKDIEGVKKSLSKSSLEFVETAAKEQNKTADELLTGGAVENQSKKIPEVRNEKIEGNTATVEYKDETMPEFIKMPLVKEDGTWKIALDKFMQDLLKRVSEEMKKAE